MVAAKSLLVDGTASVSHDDLHDRYEGTRADPLATTAVPSNRTRVDLSAHVVRQSELFSSNLVDYRE